jgi:hypothetical protein
LTLGLALLLLPLQEFNSTGSSVDEGGGGSSSANGNGAYNDSSRERPASPASDLDDDDPPSRCALSSPCTPRPAISLLFLSLPRDSCIYMHTTFICRAQNIVRCHLDFWLAVFLTLCVVTATAGVVVLVLTRLPILGNQQRFDKP